MSKNKYVVYTCLFGKYDNLLKPLLPSKNFDYICFTNNLSLSSNFWKIIYIEENKDNLYLSRKIKILTHQYLSKYAKSIYIDSNLVLSANQNKLIKYLESYDLVLFEHPKKNNFTQELEQNLKNENITLQQYKFIKNKYLTKLTDLERFKPITMNRIIIRNHMDQSVINLMEKWWYKFKEIEVRRDQLALPLIERQNKTNKLVIKSNIFYYEYYLLRPHLNALLSLKFKYFIKFFLPEIIIRIFCFFYKKIYNLNNE